MISNRRERRRRGSTVERVLGVRCSAAFFAVGFGVGHLQVTYLPSRSTLVVTHTLQTYISEHVREPHTTLFGEKTRRLEALCSVKSTPSSGGAVVYVVSKRTKRNI